MADRKLSEMTAATSVAASDLLYLVSNNASKKISVETFLGGLPVPTKSPYFQTNANTQLLNATGSIDLTVPYTKISADTISYTVTLGSGTEGLEKTIVLQGTNSAVVTIVGTFSGTTAITLVATGNAVKLVYIGAAWYILGGNHTLV